MGSDSFLQRRRRRVQCQFPWNVAIDETLMKEPLFLSYSFGEAGKKQLAQDGHLLFPQLLTPAAREQLIASLGRNLEIPATEQHLLCVMPQSTTRIWLRLSLIRKCWN